MNNEYVRYCPVCQRDITASNIQEYEEGLHDGLIFVHDDIIHYDDDIEALSNGVQ